MCPADEIKDYVRKEKEILENNIQFLMELTGQEWLSIQLMPFYFFQNFLKWKIGIERDKKKKMEEKNREIAEQQKQAAKRREIEQRRMAQSRK